MNVEPAGQCACSSSKTQRAVHVRGLVQRKGSDQRATKADDVLHPIGSGEGGIALLAVLSWPRSCLAGKS